MDTNNQNVNPNEVKGCNCPMCQKCGWCPSACLKIRGHKIAAIIIVIIVLVFIGKMFFYGGHGDWNNKIVNTITVSGTGEVIVKPDMATVSFGVVKLSADVTTAQTESATKMEAILQVLKDNGVEDKDIKTTNYNIYPKYEYQNYVSYPYGKQVMVGYEVSQTVSVKIRDLSTAGAILAGVGKAGATDISGLNFTVDDEDSIKDQARDLAIKDAKAQAKVLAKSLGVRLIRITSYTEGGVYPVYYGLEKATAMGIGGGETDAPPVPTGENTITSNISITYEIR